MVCFMYEGILRFLSIDVLGAFCAWMLAHFHPKTWKSPWYSLFKHVHSHKLIKCKTTQAERVITRELQAIKLPVSWGLILRLFFFSDVKSCLSISSSLERVLLSLSRVSLQCGVHYVCLTTYMKVLGWRFWLPIRFYTKTEREDVIYNWPTNK